MDGIRPVGGVNNGTQLSAEEMAQVARLAARDRQVRAHEAQHLAAAGSLASGIEFEYQCGPDGKMYAIGGRVNISVPASQNPEEALANARQFKAAATAAADPSGKDLAAAALAGQMEAEALQNLSRKGNDPAGKPARSLPPALRGFDRTA